MNKKNVYEAVNWNNSEDSYTKIFWDQNIRQFWVDEEIPLADDKLTWMTLYPEEKEVYEHVVGGLTLLDTHQGSIGMPFISQAVEGYQKKAVLSFMGSMEHMHAKSYSSIYSTLCTMNRINEIFEWILKNKFLQDKLNYIILRYKSIKDNRSLFLAMVSSVFLETFLFYSGFFYPLYLAGQGKLINSGEIFNLIIRDESVHGVYVGLLAQELYNKFNDSEQEKLYKEVINMLNDLYSIEERYTIEIYSNVGLVPQVTQFLKYNADKALMNLGFEPYFGINDSDINPIIMNGLKTETKNHDFFSTKGNGYIKTTNVEPLKDEDFIF